MPTTRYDSYEEGGGDYEEDTEIIFTTYCTVEADIDRVFGAGSEYGDSLGVNFTDVEIIDGCLYADLEKQKFKLFSWTESNDLSPAERFERGDEPSAEDASEMIRKNYAGNEKEYELVAARVDEVVDEDGDVLVEADSIQRTIEFGDEGEAEFGEWEDLDGDTPTIDNVVSWFSGGDNGPSVTAVNLAETLTHYGDNAVVDEDDVFGWLADTTGDDILRDDLEDRRIEFFVVSRDGEDYTYNFPVVKDVETGEQIRPNNRSTESDTGNSDSAESEAIQAAAELDAGDYPEPIADFLQSGDQLNLTEERADNLLDELMGSDDNAMTTEMVEDHGGKEALIEQVV